MHIQMREDYIGWSAQLPRWMRIWVLTFMVCVVAQGLIHAGPTVKKVSIGTEVPGLVFNDTIGPCESIWLDTAGMRVITGDLDGYVTCLDGDERSGLTVTHKRKLAAGYCTGVTVNSLGQVFVGVSDGRGSWGKQKCYIVRTDTSFTDVDTVAGPYVLINGMTTGLNDTVYFTSGEFSFFFPEKGAVYCFNSAISEVLTPAVVIGGSKRPNGIWFDATVNRILFSETLGGIYQINQGEKKLVCKNRIWMDASDDLCVDSDSRVWIANPPKGFIKCYDSNTRTLTYFTAKEFGVASSCRIRRERGREVLYIAEIRNPKGEWRGRGIISVPVEELLKLVR